MSHVTTEMTTDAHPGETGRTQGRRTRTGTRPPTGTTHVPHGVRDAAPQQTTHRQHRHVAPPGANNYNYTSGHAQTALPTQHMPSAGPGVHAHYKHRPRCRGDDVIDVTSEPPHQHRPPPAARRPQPALPGKELVWQRFREQGGCGRLLPAGGSSRTLDSVHDTTQDEMSDSGSTTSGSYVLDLDDMRHQPRPLVVGHRDSFV